MYTVVYLRDSCYQPLIYYGRKPSLFSFLTAGSADKLENGEKGALSSPTQVHVNERMTGYKIFTQSFTLTFLAEWGDRSQIATIALAAAKDPIGVTFGGILGHSLCTGLAVIGGRILAARISERTVAYVGGSLFIVFGLHSLLIGA